MPELHYRNLRWMLVALIVIIVDQVSKYAVLQHFELGESLRLLPVLNLTFVFNPGAAFSFLGTGGAWVPWFFTLLAFTVTGVLIYLLLRQEKNSMIVPFALCCIIGGALGNVWDRFAHGMVVDFIHVHWMEHHFPIFNLADSAICLGAALILLASWKGE